MDRFGLLFKEIYGNANVTAYIHMTCCHAVPMLRNQPCKSLGIHANQGAEAAHKSIRQLLNFTARGGGKWQKDVPLAVLERHYRILMLGTVFGAEDLLDSALDVNDASSTVLNPQQPQARWAGARNGSLKGPPRSHVVHPSHPDPLPEINLAIFGPCQCAGQLGATLGPPGVHRLCWSPY